MIKYVMIAILLQCFSLSPQTKWIYRQLGNTLGQSIRIQNGLGRQHIERAKRILELCEKYHAIREGDKLLEIGTGWVHWEATILRLFYDVEITLFDIWDNRHFGVYKQYMKQLEGIIDKELDVKPLYHERVHSLLRAIAKADSFEEAYNLLNFRYVTDSRGILQQFQEDTSFALVFSYNVLEHVDRVILSQMIQDFYRLLKPSGYSIHKIDPGDHLAYYCRKVSYKNYLKYSDNVWKRCFENNVQYFNRVQRPEWLALFQKAGLELCEERLVSIDIDNIKVDKSYEHLSKQDLACVTLAVVHKKPQ